MTPRCPATMCPLFASEGSPWTGEKDALCPGHSDLDAGGCPWWGAGCSDGGPHEQIEDADRRGRAVVLGPKRQQPRETRGEPKSYDCPRASECQWQIRSGDRLCPPRSALALGLDPRNAAY